MSDACGIRTQPDQCERLATSPEVERAESQAAAGRCAQKQKARCRFDTGLSEEMTEDDRTSQAP